MSQRVNPKTALAHSSLAHARRASVSLTLASLALAPALAVAQQGMTPEQQQEFNRVQVKTEGLEESMETSGLKGLTIAGYIEPVYIYNRLQDRSGFQFLNSQGEGYWYDTSFMGSASLDLQKEMDGGTRFRLTLTPNRGVGEGIGGGIVQEATVSIPVTDLQTRLIGGQIPDWSGYEYQQPTLNPLTSHNLLYDFTLPFAYTGIGVDVTRGKWWVRAVIANMNETRKDSGDTTPVLAYRVDYSKGEFDGFGFAGAHGKATNYNACNDDDVCGDSRLDIFEVDGYFIRGDWTLQGQASIGRQKNASILAGLTGVPSDGKWWGVSALAGYSVTPRLQALVRADYIDNSKNGGGLFGFTEADDRNGIGPDATLGCSDDPTIDGCAKGANRYAVTAGVKFLYNLNTTFKFELRHDGATKPVFLDVKSGEYKKSNQMIAASLVVAF